MLDDPKIKNLLRGQGVHDLLTQPPSVAALNAMKQEEASPAIDMGTLRRVACKRLGLGFEPEVKQGIDPEIYHYLGTFKIGDNEATIEAVVDAYRRQVYGFPREYQYDFLTYKAFLYNCKNILSLQSRARQISRHAEPSLSPIEQQFVCLYSIDRYTQDAEGYGNYIRDVLPELARLFNEHQPVYFPEQQRRRNTYVLGTIGSGKTELLKTIIRSYVLQPKSAAVVVLDPAGEFVDQIAHWPEFVGTGAERLVFLKLDLRSGMVPTINPFEIYGVKPADTTRDGILAKRQTAQQLFNAFEQIITMEGGGAFTTPMRSLLRPCIMTLLDKRGATFLDLLRFFDDANNRDLVDFGAQRHHDDTNARFFESQFYRDETLKVTKTSLHKKLQNLLSTGIFEELTCGKSTLHLEEAINERKIILFDLAVGRIGEEELQAFGRLIVAMIQGIAVRRIKEYEEGTPVVPFHLIVDECHNFISPSIEKLLKECRKFESYCTLCQQNVGDGMDNDLRNVVGGMTRTKIAGVIEPQRHHVTASLFPFETSEFARIDTGQFFVRIGVSPVFKLYASDAVVGKRHAMAPETWERRVGQQIDRYYRSAITKKAQAIPGDDAGAKDAPESVENDGIPKHLQLN
ncbi:MAG: DUF87 domain-containing protein [Alphaproteobacteria bacterium]